MLGEERPRGVPGPQQVARSGTFQIYFQKKSYQAIMISKIRSLINTVVIKMP